MNNSLTIPTGTSILGRFLDTHGEPLDGKESLTGATRTPLITPAQQTGQQGARTMLEMGIKPVDLLAPLTRGGINSIFAGVGVGKLVLTEEFMYTIITHYNGYIVCLGMDEGSYEQSELMDVFQELGMQDKIVLLYERMTSEPQTFQRMVRAAFTIAAQFQQQGHEVLLIADKNIVTQGNLMAMPEIKQLAAQYDVTTLLLRKEGDVVQEGQEALNVLDERIVLVSELARKRLYPALDYQRSDSRLLHDGLVSEEHVQVAQQVRQLLRRAQELQSSTQKEQLSSEEQQLVDRAARMQQFLTHPFFVAEPFSDKPGAFVPIEQTIRDCKAILDGRYDMTPVEAFAYVGTVGA